jgi:predicted HicB family RNase H-like nuclease
MYLDEGEELNVTRGLNNYLTFASQMVQQVRRHSHIALWTSSDDHLSWSRCERQSFSGTLALRTAVACVCHGWLHLSEIAWAA